MYFLYVIFKPEKPIKNKIYADYKSQIQQALQYCNQHNLNNHFFFLVDLSVHSGKKRMHLIDFNKRLIRSSYMVSHGCGSYFWNRCLTKTNATVSNEPNSHCSSVGKYIIGEKGFSNWGIGIKYLLHGKEATNSNALKRAVVLHSWGEVPENEVYPDGTPEGWGCPAVSNISMKEISKRIDASGKRILLWVIK